MEVDDVFVCVFVVVAVLVDDVAVELVAVFVVVVHVDVVDVNVKVVGQPLFWLMQHQAFHSSVQAVFHKSFSYSAVQS